ncbi:MAG: hypothetical protein QM730_19565 [Anaerolineales bacterium]
MQTIAIENATPKTMPGAACIPHPSGEKTEQEIKSIINIKPDTSPLIAHTIKIINVDFENKLIFIAISPNPFHIELIFNPQNRASTR